MADQEQTELVRTKVDEYTEARGRSSRRHRWAGLLVVWAFAACVLLYGLIPGNRAGHMQGVRNDGLESNVFMFHGEPYGVFVEDFHLYTVRAQRIADRGWTSSPMAHVPEERASYASPVQVLLGRLAASTDGRVGAYSVLLFIVLAGAWGLLYWIAATWLPAALSRKGILLAVLVTALFQYVTNFREVVGDLKGLVTGSGGFTSLWPMDRALRLATNAWSSPLLLAGLIVLSAMLFWGAPRRKGLIVFGSILLVLLCGDTWAFGLGFMTGFLALIGYGIVRWKSRTTVAVTRPDLWFFVGTVFFLIACFIGQRVLSGSVTGDALVRGGFGALWKGSPDGTTLGEIARFGRNLLPLLVVVFALAAVRRFHGPFKGAVLLAAYPTVAFFAVEILFWKSGVQLTQATQVFWRAGYVLLFVLLLLVFETVRQSLLARAIRQGKEPGSVGRALLVGWSLCIVCLGAYHVSRVMRFVGGPEAREIAITRDLEELRTWVRALPDRGAGKTIATLGMEINHQLGYWSKADLALPVGFPLQNNQSNNAIIDRTVLLLRFYNVQASTFDAFNLRAAPDNQNSWKQSGRLTAERQGYLFFLFHMDAFVLGREKDKQAAPEMVAILAKLREPRQSSASALSPDIVILDEVSQAMGASPDLSGYTMAFSHGKIEAWVKR